VIRPVIKKGVTNFSGMLLCFPKECISLLDLSLCVYDGDSLVPKLGGEASMDDILEVPFRGNDSVSSFGK
jgi:hypothetical protein